MKYLLDASVGAKAVLPELHSDKAVRLLDEYRQALHDLLSPDFYPVEVAHALTRAERQGRITPAEGAVAMQATLRLLPRLEAAVPLLPRAYAVSSTLRVGVYDCVYVALAERERCELVTADDKLVKNLGKHFPFIVPLASLP
jgi:predicted nucleic acid-binding protein